MHSPEGCEKAVLNQHTCTHCKYASNPSMYTVQRYHLAIVKPDHMILIEQACCTIDIQRSGVGMGLFGQPQPPCLLESLHAMPSHTPPAKHSSDTGPHTYRIINLSP